MAVRLRAWLGEQRGLRLLRTHGCVLGMWGLSGYLDPLGTGQLTLDSYPTNSNPDAGCTDPAACNYDPEATEDNGTCLENDLCGICGGDGTSCAGCTDSTACNYDETATLDDGTCIFPQNDLPCDCIKKVQSMWFSVRKNPRSHLRSAPKEPPLKAWTSPWSDQSR